MKFYTNELKIVDFRHVYTFRLYIYIYIDVNVFDNLSKILYKFPHLQIVFNVIKQIVSFINPSY